MAQEMIKIIGAGVVRFPTHLQKLNSVSWHKTIDMVFVPSKV